MVVAKKNKTSYNFLCIYNSTFTSSLTGHRAIFLSLVSYFVHHTSTRTSLCPPLCQLPYSICLLLVTTAFPCMRKPLSSNSSSCLNSTQVGLSVQIRGYHCCRPPSHLATISIWTQECIRSMHPQIEILTIHSNQIGSFSSHQEFCC